MTERSFKGEVCHVHAKEFDVISSLSTGIR